MWWYSPRGGDRSVRGRGRRLVAPIGINPAASVVGQPVDNPVDN